MSELVILVDEQDNEKGVMPKLEAHEQGVLHRAFSVFIFNSAGEMLLQQRAAIKYHSSGLWSNACCSHPRPGEAVHDAAVRRLKEEMGITCAVSEVFSFVYHAKLDRGLIEHEYDHVLMGVCDDTPRPDPKEVAGWQYLSKEDLESKMKLNPERYTEWFKLCIEHHSGQLYNNQKQKEATAL